MLLLAGISSSLLSPPGGMARSLHRVAAGLILLSATITCGLIWLTWPHDISEGVKPTRVDRRLPQHPARPGRRGKPTDEKRFSFIGQIWWHAPVFSGGGYSSEAVDFLLSLQLHAKAALRHTKLYAVQHGDLFDENVLQGMRRNDSAVLTGMMAWAVGRLRRAITICHSEPGAWALPEPLYETTTCPPPGSKYNIGRTMFETDRLGTEHVRRCNAMHEVWVPTQFHKDVFAQSGVKPSRIVVVPEPVDTDFFDPGRVAALPLPKGRPMFGRTKQRPAQPFVLLSVFKWEKRKAWDVLLEAFLSAFTARDPVELYLLTHPFHGKEDFEQQAKEWATGRHLHPGEHGWPSVQVITEHIPQQDLPRLYAAADVFVLPSRGEGWGRPHVEAMSMGLPVIATNWSGPTAFLDETCGYPLKYEGLVEVTDEGAFRGHRWAQPSVQHLRELLQLVVSHPEDAKARGRRARWRMQHDYSYPVTAKTLIGHLQRIDNHLQLQPHPLG